MYQWRAPRRKAGSRLRLFASLLHGPASSPSLGNFLQRETGGRIFQSAETKKLGPKIGPMAMDLIELR